MNKKQIIIAFAALLLILSTFYLWRVESEDDGALTLFGNVDVRQVQLGFRVKGRVESMPFEEGNLVKPGDIVAVLDPTPYADEVKRAQANLRSTVVALKNAETIFERRSKLVNSGAVSNEDYDDAASRKDELIAALEESKASLRIAETQLDDTQILAPSEGTILTRIREPGSVVNVGDPVYAVSILSPVWIRAFVNEPRLGKIYPGMKARIFTDSETHYDGHIGFISPVAEFTPKTVETLDLRTDLVYRIRVVVDNPDQFLRQGMPVTIKLEI